MNYEDQFDDDYINYLDIEKDNHRKGLNPLFGKLKLNFNFEPRTYESKKKDKFKLHIQQVLSDIQYMFYGEVSLVITLYFNEKKRYETSDYGDLDNYSKVICDAIKGNKGVLIDDSQIQSLHILWIDTYSTPYFTIELKASPDDFIMKPLVMVEMPDKLYYPFSRKTWTSKGPIDITDSEFEMLVESFANSIKSIRKVRHDFRKNGTNELDAYNESKAICPLITGFHKSRVNDSGLELVTYRKFNNGK